MDLTPIFDELLAKHNVHQTRKKYSVSDIDGFLKEAYRIKSHITSLHNELKDVRQAYLSTAQARKSHIRTGQQQQRFLTDRDREEIDANAKQMLRELNASIRALEEAETLRRETESALIRKKFVRGLGALGSWAAGGGGASNENKTAEHAAADGQAKDIGIHRDGVLWFLRQKLQLCGRTQADMMESRLTREMEKNRSVLAKAGGGGAMPELTGFYETTQTGNKSRSNTTQRPPEAEPAPYAASDLTEEQLQMFEKGNQDMVQHYNSTLDKVRTAEKSLLEISELQTLLVGNLATQSAHIEQLVTESENTTENVGSGNKQLKEASKRPSAARYTFFASAGVCAFLIVWDLIF
ncbi:snare-complex protein syntaxin-18 [Plectosphaerella plurivora]|uniref:Snare-complex protein syntaxin-18 n=1 Tax=Plectosphaerella plurivora TaxID=936078 RepID=A0A9P9A3H0_9PEZI|nr:snare-complex protein syntaxin-18 [Plectosphaerella plurivora]